MAMLFIVFSKRGCHLTSAQQISRVVACCRIRMMFSNSIVIVCLFASACDNLNFTVKSMSTSIPFFLDINEPSIFGNFQETRDS